MVGEGGICEKDLKLVRREIDRRGEQLQKKPSDNLRLDVSGGRDKVVVRGVVGGCRS